MTRIALMLLFLTGCGSLPARDDSPASDLQILRQTIASELPERPLPNGRLYCVELAETQRQADACSVALEDNVFLREQDRRRALRLLDQGLRRIELSRDPCNFFERAFNRKRCNPKIPL